MNAKRASLGFSLIAKNARDTLPLTLKSIRPYCEQIVVAVDETDRQHTDKVAKKHGADVVVPVQVSDWHECERHGRVLAQDFAKARNDSFTHLDQNLDFMGWIDSDDVLEGAEHLASVCQMPQECIGAWSTYEYAWTVGPDGRRQSTTSFDRERLFRTKWQGQPLKWTWQFRVHEVCTPERQGPWATAPMLTWVHQDQAHKTEQSAPRNLLLLEIEYETHPTDPRTIFYMGNQMFAMGRWVEAAHWYERYAQLPNAKDNPYELWQARVYLSFSKERLGDLHGALSAAYGALETVPYHPEPYYRLAQLYVLMGENEKCQFWTRLGDQMKDAPFFAFKNPMERTWNKYMPLADALLADGHITEARVALEQASKTYEDERVRQKIEFIQGRERAMTEAQAYVDLTAGKPLDVQLDAYNMLSDAARGFARTRNVAMTALRHNRQTSTQPKIIFWCGRALEPWSPRSLETGIGGSETAVIEIAKRFAAAGWLVDVYNAADFMEGVYDGVGYWDPERFPAGESCDVFVSWRNPAAHALPVKAKQRVLWCHDLNYGDKGTDFLKWDKVLGVSQWHAGMLASYYFPTLLESGYGMQRLLELVGFVPNGIDLARFAEPVTKKPFQCVYASSPDRGLLKLLDLWPQIVTAEPAARLHIAYGWENIDKMIAQGRQAADLMALKEAVTDRLERLGESVVWRGRLGQQELAKLYAESYLWLYPTGFLEVSCISAMEAMAGGAVPITTHCGALPETIGDAGFLLPSPDTGRAYAPLFVSAAIGALQDRALRQKYVLMGQMRSQTYTWDAAFERWLAVLGLHTTTQGDPDIPSGEASHPLTQDSEASVSVPSPDMVAA